VRTNAATGVTKTTASINGSINNPSNYSLSGYFEYGTTINLGYNTASKSLGSSSSINFSDPLSGLSENTIYFYRAVSIGSNGIEKGLIEIFQTPSTPKAKVVTKTVTPTTIIPVNTVKTYKTIYVPVQVETDVPIENAIEAPIYDNNLGASAFWGAQWFASYGPIFWLLIIIIILLIIILARTYTTRKNKTTTVVTHDNDIH